MSTKSIVQHSAKIFSKDSKYLESLDQEAKSTYNHIASLRGAPAAEQSNRGLRQSLLKLVNCHRNVKAATDEAKKNKCVYSRKMLFMNIDFI